MRSQYVIFSQYSVNWNHYSVLGYALHPEWETVKNKSHFCKNLCRVHLYLGVQVSGVQHFGSMWPDMKLAGQMRDNTSTMMFNTTPLKVLHYNAHKFDTLSLHIKAHFTPGAMLHIQQVATTFILHLVQLICNIHLYRADIQWSWN